MFEHILVAVDFSPAWEPLKQRLAQLREWGADRATLVYVLSSRYPAAPEEIHRPYYQRRLAEEAAALRQMGYTTATRLPTGVPGRELARVAEQAGADLLLLGSRGHGRVHEFLLGSTALDAARLTRVPLWLEPITAEQESESGTLLLATDGSEAVRGAEDCFRRLAGRFERSVALTARGASEGREREKTEAREHLEALASGMAGLEIRLVPGDPRQVVVEVARELRADLTVVGKRGRSAIGDLLLGSTAETVCRRARRPVLLVPGRP